MIEQIRPYPTMHHHVIEKAMPLNLPLVGAPAPGWRVEAANWCVLSLGKRGISTVFSQNL
jgi:hypothetical protein